MKEEFSDAAIECCLILRSLFHLALRGTQGFIEGMIQLLNLDIEAPHYTLLCKRAGDLKIDLNALPTKNVVAGESCIWQLIQQRTKLSA